MTRPLESFTIIPNADLTPAGCESLAERGEAALAAIDRWGIGRGLRNSLSEAVARLRAIALRGAFGPEESVLVADSDAIALTIDFFQFLQCVGDEPIPVVADELAKALEIGYEEAFNKSKRENSAPSSGLAFCYLRPAASRG